MTPRDLFLAALTSAKLTPAAFAAAAGVARINVNRFISGERDIKSETLAAWLSVCGRELSTKPLKP